MYFALPFLPAFTTLHHTFLQTTHSKSVVLLIIAAVLWSTGGVIIKLSSVSLSALSIAGARSTIAAIMMLLWIRKPKPTWSAAQISGIISYALMVSLFVIATKETTSANAILLQYTAPIWVALCSWVLLRERLHKADYLATGAVMAGIAVLFLDTASGGSLYGNLLGVASGIAYAGVTLSMRAQRGVSTLETVIFGNILAALITLPFGGSLEMSATTLFQIILLGTLQLGLSFILYAKAVKHVSAIETVLYTTLNPILNPLWVAFYLNEMPSGYAITGGLCILCGVVLRTIFTAKQPQLANEPDLQLE